MKYLIGLLITIGVIIFIIIKLLSGGGGPAPQTSTSLTDYANTETVMRYMASNPIQASQNHRIIQIDVGQNEASLTIYKGFEGEVISHKTFPMNSTAYENFLAGLKNTAGYTSGKPDLGDGQGYCANGDRFNYQIVDSSGELTQNYWSTTCASGSYKGLIDTTRQMFQAQIPDYDTLTQDVEM